MDFEDIPFCLKRISVCNIWPAIISAIGSIAGGALSGQGARDANQANVKLAREQMSFQERMSNTSHQREVADLKAAGLNPMLGIMKGSGGSSTPPGQTAKVENTQAAVGEGISSAARSAAEVLLIKAQARKTAAEAAITEATVPFSANNALATARTMESQWDKLRQEVHNLRREGTLKDIDIEKLKPLVEAYMKLENRGAELGIPEKEAMAEFFKAAGGTKNWLDIVKQVLSVTGRSR